MKREIVEIIKSEPSDIMSIASTLLDFTIEFGKVEGRPLKDGFEISTPHEKFQIHLEHGICEFRAILARMGVQAREISGNMINLYGDSCKFEWKGVTLQQEIHNKLGNLNFKIKRDCQQHNCT